MGGFVLVTHVISVLPVLWDSSPCRVNSLCTWTDRTLSLGDCRVERVVTEGEDGERSEVHRVACLRNTHTFREATKGGWGFRLGGCSEGLHHTMACLLKLPCSEGVALSCFVWSLKAHWSIIVWRQMDKCAPATAVKLQMVSRQTTTHYSYREETSTFQRNYSPHCRPGQEREHIQLVHLNLSRLGTEQK